MNSFVKSLGLILVLLGVVCLVVYANYMPSNSLLVSSIALEFAGILSFILLNKLSK